MKRIVILGAGFSGVYTATHLSQRVGDRAQITLVDANNYHLFKPMLHEVATGSVEPGHIVQPVSHILEGRRCNFIQGMVQHIDLDRRRVHVCEDCLVCSNHDACPFEDFDVGHADLKLPKPVVLRYEYLVVAVGGAPNYRGIHGARTHAFPLNTLEDAKRLREHILHAFGVASRVQNVEKRKEILTFAVVGAGPTGLEFVVELHDWVQGALLSEFREIDRRNVELYLIEAGTDILPASPDRVRHMARKLIAGRSIVQLSGSPVIRVGKDFLQTNRDVIRTYTVIWTTGVKGNQLLSDSGFELDHLERVVVDGHLTAKGLEHVFAIGDCSACTPDGAQRPLPQTGQVAVQEAQYLVKRLSALLAGKAVEPFRYRELGTAFPAGRYQGMADVLGRIHVRGLSGWIVWKLTYLKHLVSIRLSFRSVLEWFFDISYDREATRHKFQA